MSRWSQFQFSPRLTAWRRNVRFSPSGRQGRFFPTVVRTYPFFARAASSSESPRAKWKVAAPPASSTMGARAASGTNVPPTRPCGKNKEPSSPRIPTSAITTDRRPMLKMSRRSPSNSPLINVLDTRIRILGRADTTNSNETTETTKAEALMRTGATVTNELWATRPTSNWDMGADYSQASDIRGALA